MTRHNKFYLLNDNGFIIGFTNLGGRIFSAKIPHENSFIDVIVGAKNLSDYLEQDAYSGAICGRYANRIANAQIEIDGICYQLDKNEGKNTLHGGVKGFHTKYWNVEQFSLAGYSSAFKLSYLSENGEQGFPGNLSVTAIYALNNNNEFLIDFEAVTDRATVVNLTVHPYFNLNGEGNIRNHKLQLFAKKYTPVNSQFYPNGEILSLKDTLFDFIKPKPLSVVIDSKMKGIDTNFVLDKSRDKMQLAAILSEISHQRRLEVYTTNLGLQVYTANHFNKQMKGKNEKSLFPYSGVALEAQNFPNAPNQDNFPKAILRPHEIYKQKICYKFIF